MSGESLAGWVVFGVAMALHIVTSLVAGVAAGRSPGVRLLRAPAQDGNGNGGPQPLFQAAVPVAARSVAYTSLVVAGAALFVGLGHYTDDDTRRGVIVGGGMAAGLAVIHVTGGILRITERSFVERAARPAESVFGLFARIPGLKTVLLKASGVSDQVHDPDDIVTAAFQQNLDILEAAGVATDVEELRMIRGVLDLDTTRVREIMRPRVDMVAAPATMTRRDVVSLMIAAGYSKIPVYKDRIDDIVGIVYARDLLKAQAEEPDSNEGIGDLVRPAIFVPESQFLEHLLQEFQRHRVQMAIVVDEYGGVAGLVTHQDLVEEIVGELEDEFDEAQPGVEQISDVESMVDAGVTLDSLNQAFGTAIHGDGFDTVGGLVYSELGRMPTAGDRVTVDSLHMTVESTTGRRIRKIRVTRRTPAGTADS